MKTLSESSSMWKNVRIIFQQHGSENWPFLSQKLFEEAELCVSDLIPLKNLPSGLQISFFPDIIRKGTNLMTLKPTHMRPDSIRIVIREEKNLLSCWHRIIMRNATWSRRFLLLLTSSGFKRLKKVKPCDVQPGTADGTFPFSIYLAFLRVEVWSVQLLCTVPCCSTHF